MRRGRRETGSVGIAKQLLGNTRRLPEAAAGTDRGGDAPCAGQT